MPYPKPVAASYNGATSHAEKYLMLYGKVLFGPASAIDRRAEFIVYREDLAGLVTMVAGYAVSQPGERQTRELNGKAAAWLRDLADKLEARPY